MANTDFLKQTVTKPAFPDVLWSQPEQVAKRGKLTVIGGNAHSLTAPMDAYQFAQAAGIGKVQVVLPDSLRSVAGKILEHGEYAPRNPSGGFGRQSLATFLEIGNWADGVILPGDLGKNSETTVLIERFTQEYKNWITFTNDAADDAITIPQILKEQGKCVLVLEIQQLQAYVKQLKLARTLTQDIALPQLIPLLIEMSQTTGAILIIGHGQNTISAFEGLAIVTEIPANVAKWNTKVAAYASVWLVQQPQKPLEAIACAMWQVLKATNPE